MVDANTVTLELSIPRVSQIFQPPEGSPQPTIWLAIKFPGEDKPTRTSAFPFASGYATNLKLAFQRPYSKALFNELVSEKLLVTVYRDAPPAPIQIKPDAKAKAKGEKPREVEAPLPSEFVCRAAIDLSDLLRGSSKVEDEGRPFTVINDSQDEKAKVCLEPSLAFAVSALQAPPPVEGAPEAPAPQPMVLMSREEFDRLVTFELRINGFTAASPLPAELVAAFEKGAGALVFTAALPVAVGPSEEAVLVMTDGKLNADRTAPAFPSGVAKALLSEAQVAYMTSNIDQGSLVPLELCRQLKRGADFTDPLASKYHVVGQLDLGPLVKPGTTLQAYQVPLSLSLHSALAQGVARASVVPEAPHTEGQAIEEGDIPEPSVSALDSIGLVAEVEIALSRPLLPPWIAPEPPSTTLSQLIPPKTAGGLEQGKSSTADAFRDQCRKIAREIAQEYLRMTGAGQPGADPSSHTERQREMRFFLNRSGKFAQVREMLRDSVVAVIRSRMAVPGASATAEELGPLYNDVYMCLVAEVHRALDEVFRPKPAGEDSVKGPGAEKAKALMSLAAESEAVGLWARAQQLFIDSLLGSRNPADHVAFGAFLCRKGDLGPAEEAFRESIAIDSGRLDSLASLVLLLVDLAAREDALRLREAEVVAQAARLLEPESVLAWTLLAMVYTGMGGKATEASNSLYEARRLSREVHRRDPSEGALQAARLALELQLPDAADAALKLLPATSTLPQGPQCEVELCLSKLLSLRGDLSGAMDAAKRGAVLVSNPDDLKVHLLKADAYHRAGKVQETATQYQIAVQKAQAAGAGGLVPLVAYLRLGRALQELGDLQGALKAFLLGAQEVPCASLWLGAARCLVALGDLDKADLALTEASTLDSQNPDVWGLMAAVALRQNRTAEAEQALKYALKFGFSDAVVLREIAERYFKDGAFRLAEGVLKRSLTAEESMEARLRLGEALLEQREAREAKTEVLRGLKACEEAGKLTDDVRSRATALLKRAAVELGEAPPSVTAALESDQENKGGAVGNGVKKPHEKVLLFLGTTTVH